jgi:hypothetical protein
VLLTGSFIYERSNILKQKQLVIYSMREQTAIDIFIGENTVSIADSSLLADKKNIEFNLKNARIFAGTQQISNIAFEDFARNENETQIDNFLMYSSNFFETGKHRFAIIDNDFDGYFPEHPLKVDFLILKGNPKISISGLKEKFVFDKLIFDGSNKFYSINRWKEECEKMAIPFHDVKKDGAFTANL